MTFPVIEIHTKLLNDFGSGVATRIVSGIDCIAVPFFFVASGLLCSGCLSLRDFADSSFSAAVRVRNTIRRQSSLYAIWTVLLPSLALFSAHLRGRGVGEALLRLERRHGACGAERLHLTSVVSADERSGIFVYGICGHASISFFSALISHVALYAFILRRSLH